MDIRQMKYFKTIVEEGTISKAAKKASYGSTTFINAT